MDEVENRIGEVPGVESVTVNYAAGSATVRYDETQLEIADVKTADDPSSFAAARAAAAVVLTKDGDFIQRCDRPEEYAEPAAAARAT